MRLVQQQNRMTGKAEIFLEDFQTNAGQAPDGDVLHYVTGFGIEILTR